VDALLGHRGDDDRVDLVAGQGPGGTYLDPSLRQGRQVAANPVDGSDSVQASTFVNL